MADFSVYQAPGVFVEEDASEFVAVVGVQPSVVAILGQAQQYQNKTQTFAAVDGQRTVFLQDVVSVVEGAVDENVGVDLTSIAFSVPGLTEDTDYKIGVVGVDEPSVDDNVPGDTPEGSIWITVLQDPGLLDGEEFTVSYNFTPLDFFDPKSFFDFDDVQDQYGVPFSSGGAINSPLSLAARIAFANGARELVLVASEPNDFASALEKITANSSIDLIVPILNDTQSQGEVTDMVDGVAALIADNELLAMGILGCDTSFESDLLGQASGNSRLIVAWPSSLRYFIGTQNLTVDLHGGYLAAAYAGRLSGLTVQTPLTKKQIFGFSGVPLSVAQQMTPAQLNAKSQAGQCVTELTRNGQLRVRHGVTADAGSSIQRREISLIRARDRLMTMIGETVEGAGLIGTWIDADTPGRVKGVVGGVLEQALLSDVIVGYDSLKARQLPGDPSVIEVKFRYRPAYPLNYILISFSINTETGDLSVDTQAV